MAKAALKLSEKLNVELPITKQVHDVLFSGKPPRQALRELMDRALRALTPWGRPAMTGTGSGIFIPMPSRSVAIRSAREIKNLYNSRAVRGVDRSPLHRRLDAEGT